MKVTKIALGVSLGLGGLAANAADTVMFPYVVNSTTVTTVVSVIDGGNAATNRYNASGVIGSGAGFNRLHWRLNYKDGANATNNAALCSEVDYYLPTSPFDIQTVDMGAQFGSTTRGVLFNDPSINNNWVGGIGSLTYALSSTAASPSRGVLFVHNADSVAGLTVQGDAMVFEFANGAAWGYNGLTVDNGGANSAAGFDFGGFTSTTGTTVSFMPLAETTTRLFVTPLDDINAGGTGSLNLGATGTTPITMLAADGASIAGWDRFTARVGLVTGAGVAYDRDENLVSGSTPGNVTCVGALDVTGMMTGGAASVLANGGYGSLNIAQPAAGATIATTPNANVIKLEFNTAGTFNGAATTGVFNNGFRLP